MEFADGGRRGGTQLDAYQEQVRQVMTTAGWPWPEHVLLDPAKAPRFVNTVEEFLYELQLGCHLGKEYAHYATTWQSCNVFVTFLLMCPVMYRL